jgi:hypothetical protein
VSIPLVVAGPGVTPGRSTGGVSIRGLAGTIRAAAGQPTGADLRDLRQPSEERRVVTIQRRRFAGDVRPLMRRHAAAASDGQELVIVAEDGAPTQLPIGASPDLLDAARSIPLPKGDLAPLDPEMQDALKSLGYAE